MLIGFRVYVDSLPQLVLQAKTAALALKATSSPTLSPPPPSLFANLGFVRLQDPEHNLRR